MTQEMENTAKAEDLSNVPEVLVRLEEEVERVMAQLRVEIAV